MGWDPAPRFTRIQALRLSRNIEALNLSRIRDRSLQNARFRKSGTLRSPSYGGGGEESCLKKRFLRTIWSHHFSSSILSNPIFFSFPFPFFSHHQTGQGDLAWKRCFSNPAPRKGKPPPPPFPPHSLHRWVMRGWNYLAREPQANAATPAAAAAASRRAQPDSCERLRVVFLPSKSGLSLSLSSTKQILPRTPPHHHRKPGLKT